MGCFRNTVFVVWFSPLRVLVLLCCFALFLFVLSVAVINACSFAGSFCCVLFLCVSLLLILVLFSKPKSTEKLLSKQTR